MSEQWADCSHYWTNKQGECLLCGKSARTSPREQWSFTGRQIHWGYMFLVWTRDDGKRYARWVQ